MSAKHTHLDVGFVGPRLAYSVAHRMTEARMLAFPRSEHQQYLDRLASMRLQTDMFRVENEKKIDLNDDHQNTS